MIVRWLQHGMVMLSIALLGLSVWLWLEGEAVQQLAAAEEKAAARTEQLADAVALRMQNEGLSYTPDQVSMVLAEVTFANQLTDKRTFSWTQLLRDLEAAMPPHVSLGSIKVDFQESTVHLEGVANRLQDLNRFVQTMQAHRGFHHAVLAKHEVHRASPTRTVTLQEGTEGDADDMGSHRVEFSLAAQYRSTF
jgi:Tfp pilus assembly protein PilN